MLVTDATLELIQQFGVVALKQDWQGRLARLINTACMNSIVPEASRDAPCGESSVMVYQSLSRFISLCGLSTGEIVHTCRTGRDRQIMYGAKIICS
jgi:hypothetical protein